METPSPTCKNKPKRQTKETASNAATNSFVQTGASVTRTYTAASATETINGMRKYGMKYGMRRRLIGIGRGLAPPLLPRRRAYRSRTTAVRFVRVGREQSRDPSESKHCGGRATPHIRFLFIGRHLGIGLPPDPASRRRPCPCPSASTPRTPVQRSLTP